MEHFIENIKKYKCLWQIDHPDYKNTELKDTAWLKVAMGCNIQDIKEAKGLWKKLRDGHRQALKKPVTGQITNNDRCWRYEKSMEFLIPYMTNRPRSINLLNASIMDEDTVTQDSQLEIENLKIENMEMENHKTDNPSEEYLNDEFDDQPFQLDNTDFEFIEITPTQPKKRKKDFLQDHIGIRPIKRKPNAMDMFFASMSEMTKQLSPTSQLNVQKKIFNVVIAARENALFENQTAPII